MANSNVPFGLRPIKHLNGSPWNGKLNVYYVSSAYATAMYKGDLVAHSIVAAEYDSSGKYPAIKVAAAAEIAVGVVLGFSDNPNISAAPSNLLANYRPASSATLLYAWVCDDPNVIYEIQEDSDTTSMVAADVGGNGNIVATGGSTVTGTSAHVLNSTDVHLSAGSGHTPANNQLRVLRLADKGNNAVGDYAVWEVLINTHSFRNATMLGVAQTS